MIDQKILKGMCQGHVTHKNSLDEDMHPHSRLLVT